MIDPLTPLLADGVIDEVLSRLKSGKEADIYLVQHGSEVLAAKVYKERQVRSFQNNAAYKEGRTVRNSRTQRAMQKGSRFGRDAEEDAWKTKESEALDTLFAAGVRVPKPSLFYEGVLLMEVVLDPDGRPAPRLIDAAIAPERAAELYADLRQQIVKILACDLIHGDLSPYNVLLAWNGPTVIDFPQVVGAAHNSQAEFFFRRDLEGIRLFFAGLDPTLAGRSGDAHEIWRAYVRRELTPEFVPSGRVEPARDPRREPARGGGAPRQPGQRSGRPSPRPPPGPGKQEPRREDPRGGQPKGRRPQPSPPGREGGRPFAPPPRGKLPPRPAPGPVVSYVGQAATPAPTSPGRPPLPGDPPAAGTGLSPSAKRRRRRRRNRGGGAPPTPMNP